MSFLTGLMNVRGAAEAEAEKLTAKPKRIRPKYVSVVVGKSATELCKEAYAQLFAEPRTIGAASEERDISYVGCLNQVYRYEKKGLIKRVGTSDTYGRAILWLWIGDKK